MALFGDARQRFLDCFEPRDDGFAYRWSLSARAVLVSAEERAWLVQDYDDRRELVQILMLSIPVAMVLAGFLAYAIFPTPSVVAAAVWLTFLGFPILVTLWGVAGRWALLRRRPFVDDGLPKAEVARREREQTSWAGLLMRFLPAVLWSSTLVASTDLNPIWRALGGLLGVAVFGLAVREGYLKIEQGRRLGRSDTK